MLISERGYKIEIMDTNLVLHGRWWARGHFWKFVTIDFASHLHRRLQYGHKF